MFQFFLRRFDWFGFNLSENILVYIDYVVEEDGNFYFVYDVEEMVYIVYDRMNEFYKVKI